MWIIFFLLCLITKVNSLYERRSETEEEKRIELVQYLLEGIRSMKCDVVHFKLLYVFVMDIINTSTSQILHCIKLTFYFIIY